MFRETAKYKNGKFAYKLYAEVENEWNKHNYGPIDWPCKSSKTDSTIMAITRKKRTSVAEKHDEGGWSEAR